MYGHWEQGCFWKIIDWPALRPIDDFARYEEVIGTFPELPKGLIWAHRLDHTPGGFFPQLTVLDFAVDKGMTAAGRKRK